MHIRKLNPEEYHASDILDSLSFVMPVKEENASEIAYKADRWGYFGEDGILQASLVNHDLPIWFDGRVAAARGVGNVASDPVSRGQGNIRALLRHILADDRANGQLFSALYPFSHPFYRKFGYETCCEQRKVRFPSTALRCFHTKNAPKARMILPEDGIEALYPIYTAYAQACNLAVARDARTWHRRKPGDPYKTEQYYYVISRDGKDTAYAIFNFRPEKEPFVRTLCLTDYAFIDSSAFSDLMSFLYRYTAQAKDVEMLLPESLPLSSLLPEPYVIEDFTIGRPMARVLHVENVLKAMRHPAGDGAYSVFVEDDVLPENEGGYTVRYANGEVTVTRTDEATDLRLSVQTFTQLALGFLNITQAAFKPDVQINGNSAVLEQVLINKPVFLWDFY